MHTEIKIIVGLSTALGIAVVNLIGQNEQIKNIKEKGRRKDAVSKIYMKAFERAVSTMNEQQLLVAINALHEEQKFYSIVKDII